MIIVAFFPTKLSIVLVLHRIYDAVSENEDIDNRWALMCAHKSSHSIVEQFAQIMVAFPMHGWSTTNAMILHVQCGSWQGLSLFFYSQVVEISVHEV